MTDVCVLGMSHLGCVNAAGFSRLGKKVVGCDTDTNVINGLKQCKPPIFEPGLEEAVRQGQEKGTLSFTTDIPRAVSGARFIYVALDTPVDHDNKADLGPVLALFDAMTPHLPPDGIVMLASQVPIGTSRRLLQRLRDAGRQNELCCIPENLRLGTALENFLRPERTAFGISSQKIRQPVEALFADIPGEKLFMSLESVEMSKHAMNSYLATMISFSSEICDLCEKTGANAIDVINALRAEKRVSRHAPILPGLGFGGGTLGRDVQVLRSLGKQCAVPTRVMDSVIELNLARMRYVPDKLRFLLGDINGKTIAFFGLTYKPNSDNLKRSLALQIIDLLSTSGAVIRAYDPKIRGSVASHPQIIVCDSPEAAVKGADALVITTAWDDFTSLDYARMAKAMRNPVVIDTTNRYGTSIGSALNYHGIGVTHER
jgi:UDPglucose 6-dehydrogenase